MNKLDRLYLSALRAVVKEKREESQKISKFSRDWVKRLAREKTVTRRSWPVKASHEADILDGISRLAYSSWKADRDEERGRIYAGQQHYLYKPASIPSRAKKWAREVALAILQQEKKGSLTEIFEIVKSKYGYTGDAEQFGNDLAYEAMRAGVNWRDRANRSAHNSVFDVPYHEFYM